MAENTNKTIIWERFSQSPFNPLSGNNPITKIVNMELSSDKTIRTRRNFSAISGISSPENQFSVSLKNTKESVSLLLKSGTSLYKYNGTSFSEIQTSEVPYGSITPGVASYFSAYGGEVYYCESYDTGKSALFSYDGNEVRNLGVPAYTGPIDGSNPSICSSQDFSIDGVCGCACSYEGTTEFKVIPDSACAEASPGTDEGDCDDCQGTVMHCVPHIPGFSGIFCFTQPTACIGDGRGEKILNCAYKIGLYDPERGIFGRASFPKSVINFGPNRSRSAMFQHQIEASVPIGVPDKYQIAVWCTIGMEVLEYSSYQRVGPFLMSGTSHAMSDFFGGAMFLEGIFANTGGGNPEIPECVGLCLYKDQTLLTNSGQYTGVYDRPVPSKSMCILSNGVAVYFNPIQLDPKEPYNFNEMSYFHNYKDGNYLYLTDKYKTGAEYSVGHPEQIGRYNSEGTETFSTLPGLKGEPIRIFNDGGSTIMLTRQSIYQVGFSNSVHVGEMGGPGILDGASYHPTSSGVFYVSDEGPIWLSGGKAIEIIRKLGFDGWIDNLPPKLRRKIRIGLIESCKKIIASFPIPNSSKYRIIMHDIEDDFTSEWWLGAGQSSIPGIEEGSSSETTYMSSFRAEGEYRFLVWSGGSTYRYESTKPMTNGVTLIETWINENSHITKQLNELVIDFGESSGNIVIRISSFDNPKDKLGRDEKPTEERVLTMTDYGLRNLITYFMGMRGKFLRLRIESSDELSISRIALDIKYDESPTLLGEPPVYGTTLGK